MSNDEKKTSAVKKSDPITDPFAFAESMSKSEGVETGVQHFDSVQGNVVQGYYLGIMRVSRDEMYDEKIAAPDRRKSTLDTVYIRVNRHLIKRTANPSAVQHFLGVKPGSLVRLHCIAAGVAAQKAAQFRLILLADADEVADTLGGDMTDVIMAGFIE